MIKISICIPAYKRIYYLRRLLDSIVIQSYSNFEVIVSDDSPYNEVKDLCDFYKSKFHLVYNKNETALGTPENWNNTIRQASGQWIKLMHDDDWFSRDDSLQLFADAIQKIPESSFFFSAYTNVYEETGRKQNMLIASLWKKALSANPNILIADNVVGPPSVILHKNGKDIWYDNSMKYVVDIDFYIRFLKSVKPVYIEECLINVGINTSQVTKYTFNVPEVHLKESLYLLQKTGDYQLKNVLVFDGWWRLMRNFQIKNVMQLYATGYNGEVPSILKRIIKFQKSIPGNILKNGVMSKMLMSLCFCINIGKFTKRQ